MANFNRAIAHWDTPPLPLLITGISGVAGYNIWYALREQFADQVIGIRQTENWRMRGQGIVACDAEDAEGLARLCDERGIRGVLNCAGNCALKSCELDPAMARRINVEGLVRLLDVTVPRRIRLVHLSVDLVFSGQGAGTYREEDKPDPVTVYGRTMVEAEQLVLARDPAACVLRISLPMGVSFNGHAGAIDWIQSRFRHGRPATLYFDEVRTPTYTDCLASTCATVLASNLRGLFHAGGPRALSLFQIAQIINRVGGYDPRLLHGCPRAAAGPMPPRAGNVSLDSSKLAQALGDARLAPWPVDAALVPTDEEWHFRRNDAGSGSPQWLAELLYSNPTMPHVAHPPFFRPKRRILHI